MFAMDFVYVEYDVTAMNKERYMTPWLINKKSDVKNSQTNIPEIQLQ